MMTINWTKDELNAYLLIYCANADFTENNDEIDFIIKEVGEDIYKKMHKEYNKDNDFQSIEKIQYTLKQHNYTQDEIKQLTNEMKLLFNSDGTVDLLEDNFYKGLKRILVY